MRILLDTHTFLWWIADDGAMSPRATEILLDGSNEVYFSAASAWEIVIKIGTGKLRLTDGPASIPKELSMNGLRSLPIEVRHALQVAMLPRHHLDPFDRLLVAQAQVERLSILTRDPEIARYDVETIW